MSAGYRVHASVTSAETPRKTFGGGRAGGYDPGMNRTNLVFIYTDEQALRTLAAYGNTALAMPNLNRLAARSVVFDQAYVTQPVCTPSRGSLLTGLYPHTTRLTENNLPLAPEIPCLPELLPRGAYRTAHFGKWHLGDELYAQHGFDEWVSLEDEYLRFTPPGRDPAKRSDYTRFLLAQGWKPKNGDHFGRGEAARLPEAVGKPAFLAGEASRFIRENRARPFCLYVNFLEPHMPFFGPRDSQYDPAALPLPANFGRDGDGPATLKTRLLQEHYFRSGHSGLPLRTEAEWRLMIAHYWGLCSLVDTHAGAILRTLDECGLDDRTLVVFTSDHGDMMGSHGLLAKCVPFEEAVRVPLLIHTPGQKASRRVRGPLSQVDVVPTILDLMGEAVPGHLQGRSQRAALETGVAENGDGGVVIEWNGGNNGVSGDVTGGTSFPDWMTSLAPPEEIRAAFTSPARTLVTPDGWKLNWDSRGANELYDLNGDPGERKNRIHEPDLALRIRRMAEAIRAWQARTRDTVVLPPFPG
jgi:arylsulfatase